jgi:hypothetical protein
LGTFIGYNEKSVVNTTPGVYTIKLFLTNTLAYFAGVFDKGLCVVRCWIKLVRFEKQNKNIFVFKNALAQTVFVELFMTVIYDFFVNYGRKRFHRRKKKKFFC